MFETLTLSKNGTSILQVTAKNKRQRSDIMEIARYIDQNDVVLLRGFDFETVDDFKTFSDAIGESFKPYAGGAFERKTVSGDNTVLEVSGGKTSLVPLHGEMYYGSIRPSRLWFYCEVAPTTGGETLLCDGKAFYQGLSESTQGILKNNKLSYIVTYSDQEWQAIFQSSNLKDVQAYCDGSGLVLSTTKDGGIQTTYTTSPLITNSRGEVLFINNIIPVLGQEYILGNQNRVVRWENGEKISPDIFKELLDVSDRLAYRHKLHSSDLVILSNNTMLHGRTEITDQRRRVLVRLGYEECLVEACQLDESCLLD